MANFRSMAQLRPLAQQPSPVDRFAKIIGLQQEIQGGQQNQQIRQMAIQKAQREQQQAEAVGAAIMETGGDIEAALPKIAQVAPDLLPHYQDYVDKRKAAAAKQAEDVNAADIQTANVLQGAVAPTLNVSAPQATPASYPGQIGEGPQSLASTQDVALPLPPVEIHSPIPGRPSVFKQLKSAQQQRQEADAAAARKLQDEITLKREQQKAEKEFSTVNPPQPKAQPAIVQEYEYAKTQGFKGSFDDYQNIDANRKKSVINVNAGTLTDEGLDVAANYFRRTGSFPPGLGRNGVQQTKIINRAAEMDKGLDVALSKADFDANKSSLTQATKLKDALTSFENTALSNMKILESSAQKIVDSGSPLLNRPLRSIDEKVLGSAEQPVFRAARQIVVNEVAKLTNNPNLTGQLSDTARKEIEGMIPPDMTLKQLLAILPTFRQDMKNRTSSIDQQIEAIRGRIKGGESGGSPKAAHRYNPATGKIEAIP